METEHDIWFYFAVLVSAVALFVWAFWAVTGLGGTWLPCSVAALFLLAVASAAIRASAAVRGLVPPPELREAQRRRARQLALEVAAGLLFVLSTVAIIRLAKYNLLSQSAGAALLLALLVAWLFLRRAARKSRA